MRAGGVAQVIECLLCSGPFQKIKEKKYKNKNPKHLQLANCAPNDTLSATLELTCYM
jgi:hypothetical protein